MRLLIISLYCAYIVATLDLLLSNQVLFIYSYYSIFYSVVLFFLFLYSSRGKVSKHDLISVKPLTTLLFLLVFGAFRTYANSIVWVKTICLLVILIFNSFLFKKYHIFNQVIAASFVISSLFILWRFIVQGAPREVYSKLGSLFGTAWYARYRVLFGMYHANAAGNISCCAILFSFLLLSDLNLTTALGKTKATIILILDFVNMTVLLSTDSRSSILAIIVFFLVFLFLQVTTLKNKHLRFFLRVLLLLAITILLIVFMGNAILALFVSSQRSANFEMNLPYLNSAFKVFFGLGLIDPSDFGTGTTGLGITFYVDNYFLYILLTLGITGLVSVFYIIISLFKTFLRAEHSSKKITATLLISILCGHIFTALGETCFLYPTFPSAVMYFSAYLAYPQYLEWNEVKKIG